MNYFNATFRRALLSPYVSIDYSAEILINEITANRPSMIARLGSTEAKAIIYPKLPWAIKRLLKEKVFFDMSICSGFFPTNEENICKFSKLYLMDIKSIDILGSWRLEEVFLREALSHAIKIDLNALEPYYSNKPWSAALKDMNVLVIHPFKASIEHQYHKHREKIFTDSNVLPEFKSLTVLKAVQTLASNKVEFSSWFNALDHMKKQINSIKFDIAIIGCGAYGLPLAAYIKSLGKKAIHLGGATQILFGIKGQRWDSNPQITKHYNEYWIRPLQEDAMHNSHLVEAGCYW